MIENYVFDKKALLNPIYLLLDIKLDDIELKKLCNTIGNNHLYIKLKKLWMMKYSICYLMHYQKNIKKC